MLILSSYLARANMLRGLVLLLTVALTRGFNVYKKAEPIFQQPDELFGQMMVQSQHGVLVPSPSFKKLLRCDLRKCVDIDISVGDRGAKPIMSVASLFTEDAEKLVVCQQVRKVLNMNEDFNGKCTITQDAQGPSVLSPAKLIEDPIKGNRKKRDTSNNNENNINSEEEEEDPGTEIAFLLDGSGSVEPEDFEIAKNFIKNIMTSVWEKCFNCDFAVVQFGSEIQSELLLKESFENGTKALEKVKNITQIKNATITASAIQYLLNFSFVPENGSNPNAKKIMILLSDGAISLWDKNAHLERSLQMLQENNIIRYSIGVGKEVANGSKAADEMRVIAGNEKNFFLVNDYKALQDILSQLKRSIVGGIEGLKDGEGFKFQLSEAGFSNHIDQKGYFLFGAVGANDWSGGVLLLNPRQEPMVFLQDASSDSAFSYLGYSIATAVASFGPLYISGAPRYNLTGGVFVFNSSSNTQILKGDQLGSYFGSVLCALDMDKDGVTDYLLVGAPLLHETGEEGRVYVYKLAQGIFYKEPFEWKGLEKYDFARFGAAVAAVGDLDGNNFNDVAVGAPLEEEEHSGRSGSVYIYNGAKDGISRHFSQRISAADLDRKLSHFGQSISAFGTGQKRQPYISIGSKSTVSVLQTIPVIAFKPRLELSPNRVPLQWQTNQETNQIVLKICFNTNKGNIAENEALFIPYTLELDAGQNRLIFDNTTQKKGNLTLRADTDCLDFPILLIFKGCYDCFSPMPIKLNFSVHSSVNGKPLRILDAFTPNTVTEEIEFEKDCADPNGCIGRISLSDSELSHQQVIIGSTESITISFNLTNEGDGSFMTTLVLTYPNLLQFSHLSSSTRNMAATACENDIKETISQLRCKLLHKVFKRSEQTNFTVHWQPVDRKSEMMHAEINANLTCQNRGIQVLDTKQYKFGIKHSLKVQLEGEVQPNLVKVSDAIEKREISFTFKLHGDNKYKANIYMNITLTLPARHTDLMITSVKPKDMCKQPSSSKVPTGGEYSVQCNFNEPQDVVIKANALINDVQGSSEKITASGTLGFEVKNYSLAASSMKMTSTKVEVVLLKQKVVQSLAAIIGGSVAGFFVLVVFIIVLIKCGFFKRRDEQRLESVSE